METRNLLIRTIGKMDRLGMESLHYAIMEELAERGYKENYKKVENAKVYAQNNPENMLVYYYGIVLERKTEFIEDLLYAKNSLSLKRTHELKNEIKNEMTRRFENKKISILEEYLISTTLRRSIAMLTG